MERPAGHRGVNLGRRGKYSKDQDDGIFPRDKAKCEQLLLTNSRNTQGYVNNCTQTFTSQELTGKDEKPSSHIDIAETERHGLMPALLRSDSRKRQAQMDKYNHLADTDTNIPTSQTNSHVLTFRNKAFSHPLLALLTPSGYKKRALSPLFLILCWTLTVAVVEEKKGQVAKKGAKKAVKRAPVKSGKKRRSRKESYSIYIYKVMKQVHPDTGISSKAMSVMNSFVNDIFERIAGEASRLAHYNTRSTISSREIQTAVRLLLAGELAMHAVSEGTRAVTKDTSSK
ncbi:uncharacterized protein LOC125488123 [Rhincodon typus]|uniref:uncharacterized protein LOC125488123 n=1 Tax=Rhincodon typus TaxID=259920 RepID=UPI00202EA96C|nr:uncharacterized protein LOC125488123 [Rhincodon typus]